MYLVVISRKELKTKRGHTYLNRIDTDNTETIFVEEIERAKQVFFRVCIQVYFWPTSWSKLELDIIETLFRDKILVRHLVSRSEVFPRTVFNAFSTTNHFVKCLNCVSNTKKINAFEENFSNFSVRPYELLTKKNCPQNQ